eukprot:291624-Ditylum_brightwellii.AAC.1
METSVFGAEYQLDGLAGGCVGGDLVTVVPGVGVVWIDSWVKVKESLGAVAGWFTGQIEVGEGSGEVVGT